MGKEEAATSTSNKRPMARVSRVGLFRRRIIETLSPTGIEALLAAASIISEGQLAADGRFFGSTMITIDLAQLAEHVTDDCDARTAARIAEDLSAERVLLGRLAGRARAEARRIAKRPLDRLETEVRVRAEGRSLLVDVDVEGWAEQASERSAGSGN